MVWKTYHRDVEIINTLKPHILVVPYFSVTRNLMKVPFMIHLVVIKQSDMDEELVYLSKWQGVEFLVIYRKHLHFS